LHIPCVAGGYSTWSLAFSQARDAHSYSGLRDLYKCAFWARSTRSVARGNLRWVCVDIRGRHEKTEPFSLPPVGFQGRSWQNLGMSVDRMRLLRCGIATNNDNGDGTGQHGRREADVGWANEHSVRMIASPVAVLVDADVAELRRRADLNRRGSWLGRRFFALKRCWRRARSSSQTSSSAYNGLHAARCAVWRPGTPFIDSRTYDAVLDAAPSASAPPW
jgi:hypothetical protein